MATSKQKLGDTGEIAVTKLVTCPGCKREAKTFKLLVKNFQCADVICDFCGYLAQVKSKSVSVLPDELNYTFLGGAWGPQKERMDAGIFFSLYFVLIDSEGKMAIWFLPRDLQSVEMFEARKPLSQKARRAGWQGFTINVEKALAPAVRLL